MRERAAAERLDAADPLAGFRARFRLPEGLIYLDGNSLGALPAATGPTVEEVLDRQWGRDLIRSWNAHDWIGLPQRVAAGIAKVIGARPHEVAVADSTSVNLFKLLAAARGLRPGRRVVLAEAEAFPTDLYVAQGLIDLLGGALELRLAPAGQPIESLLDETVLALLLTHVDYRSGAVHDLRGLSAAAARAGALSLWDLAHSAGIMPIALAEDGADLAVGCGYKYLNGGPGAPSFLFVAERHLEALRQPLWGWMGHAAPFAFEGTYRPAAGIDRCLVGTPPILSLAALAVGVELAAEADLAAVRRKAAALSELLIELALRHLGRFGFRLASPRDATRRGAQVALAHDHAWPIMQALIAAGVIGDVRAPDLLRFGLAPLYVRFVDVVDAIERLHAIMVDGSWRAPRFQARAKVT